MALSEWAKQGPPGVAMNSVSLSSEGSTEKDVTRYPMDMQTARQYWAFYHGGYEPTLEACRKLRHDNTFHGPLEVLWGSGDTDPIRLDGPGEQDMLKDLFRSALEWRDVFGMVPMYLRRRAKRHRNRPLISIPSFGSGKFVLEYNSKDFTSKMVYEISENEGDGSASASASAGAGAGAAGGTGRSAATRSKTKSKKSPFPTVSHGVTESQRKKQPSKIRILDVYVWHGSMPDITLLQFRSTMQALLPKYSELAELRRNLLAADRGNAFPTIFTETAPDKRGVAEMTEQEQFGRLGDPGIVSPHESNQYLRDTHRAIRQEQMTAAQNAAARDLPVAQFDSSTQRLQRGAVARWPGTIEPLPTGESIARAVNPSSRSDIGQFEERFTEQMCIAMGVPYGYIRHASGTKIRGETDQMKAVFRAAIARDRQDINSFYAVAHELMHRVKDDAFLTQALVQIHNATDAASSAEELARREEIQANIEKIAQMPQRVRVVFVKDPFPRDLDLRVLEAASKTGSISVEEQANLLRQELGLDPLDDDSVLLRGIEADEAPILDAALSRGTGAAAGLGTHARNAALTTLPMGTPASSSAAAAAAAAAAASAEPESLPKQASITDGTTRNKRSRKRTAAKAKTGKEEEGTDADDQERRKGYRPPKRSRA